MLFLSCCQTCCSFTVAQEMKLAYYSKCCCMLSRILKKTNFHLTTAGYICCTGCQDIQQIYGVLCGAPGIAQDKYLPAILTVQSELLWKHHIRISDMHSSGRFNIYVQIFQILVDILFCVLQFWEQQTFSNTFYFIKMKGFRSNMHHKASFGGHFALGRVKGHRPPLDRSLCLLE